MIEKNGQNRIFLELSPSLFTIFRKRTLSLSHLALLKNLLQQRDRSLRHPFLLLPPSQYQPVHEWPFDPDFSLYSLLPLIMSKAWKIIITHISFFFISASQQEIFAHLGVSQVLKILYNFFTEGRKDDGRNSKVNVHFDVLMCSIAESIFRIRLRRCAYNKRIFVIIVI